jgi:signal transduction histidine kinase
VTERAQSQELLFEHGRQIALLEDRERIARDLHDRVIQRLFASGLALQGIASSVADRQVVSRLERTVDEIDESIRDLRTVIFGLTRRTNRAGLRDAIVALVKEAGRALGFEPRARFHGPVDALVPEPVGEQLLAALREMLANVAKHAHASAVNIDVEAGDDLVLRVSDNGIGMPATPRHHGEGLPNLASRARALGGSFSIVADDGGGTTAEWRVPL